MGVKVPAESGLKCLFLNDQGQLSKVEIFIFIGFVLIAGFILHSLIYCIRTFTLPDSGIIGLCALFTAFIMGNKIQARQISAKFGEMNLQVELERLRNVKCSKCGGEVDNGESTPTVDNDRGLSGHSHSR